MPHLLSKQIGALLQPIIPPHSRVLLGLSGGVDSMVLLHLLRQLASHYHWHLSALHVHHDISPNADAWANFCAQQCQALGVPLHIERVDITPLRELGIEAAARKLRHAAFATQVCDFIVLAHHADDQSETLLLQLLRGAGVRGASAMPLLSQTTASQAAVMRPLLHSSRNDILNYAAAHDLPWIEDESNADVSYPRNFLRHHVMPMLAEKFPAYRDTLVRSAQHFAEASQLLDELAAQDAQHSLAGYMLDMAALQPLADARSKNLLRYFLYQVGAPMPSTVLLDTLLQQLRYAQQDAAVLVEYAGWQIRRYQNKVYAQPALAQFDAQTVVSWHGEPEVFWPALQQHLHFHQTTGAGISYAKLQSFPVTLRLRQGGETLRPQRHAATRTLKNLLQEHRIPPWQRERWPLLYHGDELVCVVGLAIAAHYQAVSGETALQLQLVG